MGDECGQDRKHRISVKPSHAWAAHRRADQLNIEHLFCSFRYETTIAGKDRFGKTGLRQPCVRDAELDGIVSFVFHNFSRLANYQLPSVFIIRGRE